MKYELCANNAEYLRIINTKNSQGKLDYYKRIEKGVETKLGFECWNFC